MGLHFFESGKKQKDPIYIYKDQLFIYMNKNDILYFIKNIIEDYINSEEDIIEIGLAGELKSD